MRAACRSICSRASSAAMRTACAMLNVVRLPAEMASKGVVSVSAMRTLTFWTSAPRTSAATWAITVAAPVPRSAQPASTARPPSSFTFTTAPDAPPPVG